MVQTCRTEGTWGRGGYLPPLSQLCTLCGGVKGNPEAGPA